MDEDLIEFKLANKFALLGFILLLPTLTVILSTMFLLGFGVANLRDFLVSIGEYQIFNTFIKNVVPGLLLTITFLSLGLNYLVAFYSSKKRNFVGVGVLRYYPLNLAVFTLSWMIVSLILGFVVVSNLPCLINQLQFC